MRDPWLWLGFSFLIAGGVYGAGLDEGADAPVLRRAALSPALLDQLEEIHRGMADPAAQDDRPVDVIIRVKSHHTRRAAVRTMAGAGEVQALAARRESAEMDLADLIQTLEDPSGVRVNPDEGIHPLGAGSPVADPARLADRLEWPSGNVTDTEPGPCEPVVVPDGTGATAGREHAASATRDSSRPGQRRSRGRDLRPLWLCRAVACRLSAREVEAVAQRSDVEMVFPDRTFDMVPPALARATEAIPVGMLGDPRAWTEGATWGVAMVGAPTLWARGVTGTGIVVGHIDTGVAPLPLLADRIAQYADFTSHRRNVQPADDNGHGTHTAGILASAGGIGVAPGVRLVVAKALDHKGGGRLSHLLGAMEWMTRVDPRPRVVSCSWGIPVRGISDGRELFAQELEAWQTAGIMGVFASGNEGPGTLDLPGACPEALAVGALDPARHAAEFTSSGTLVWQGERITKPEVWAPGVEIPSLWPARLGDDRVALARASGTSMACPHVAGVAALLLAAHPQASIAMLRQALTDAGDGEAVAAASPAVDAPTAPATDGTGSIGDGDGASGGASAIAGESASVVTSAVASVATGAVVSSADGAGASSAAAASAGGTHPRAPRRPRRAPGNAHLTRPAVPPVTCIDAVASLARLERSLTAGERVAVNR